MSKPLDYLRSSPVRGQIEPYDSTSPAGWRYIQTTDTLNELKVLIPPGTAAMYEQLLKLENYELTKKSINWPRILEIRHLKERMVRKCQKLAKLSIAPPKSLQPFQTFVAPEDFRVKEMERWFREQQKRANAAAVRRASDPIAQETKAAIAASPNHDHVHTQCPQCIAAGASSAHPPSLPPTKLFAVLAPLPNSNLQRSATNASTNSKTSTKPGLISRAQALINASRAIKPERTTSLPANEPEVTRASTRASVVSPPPLPVLLRGQRSLFGLDDELGQADSALGDPELPESSVGDSPPPPIPKDTSPNPSGSVRRRRSCIKRNSVSELGAKTVSWADDQELDNQVSRYASAARDAQTSGRRWEEIREIYLEQITGLETLQLQVQEGLESLKTESEHLQRVDDTIRRQREQLRLTFDDFERKQGLFNEKVREALEQADDVMSRHGLRKPALSITNE
ncbi:hypothetical protein P691DRAFT_657472 [Macrolepiota fuliginosa MF-IS2]|uniref:Uncharacterized protein n=1 Tax=Macrolepiota fuliginosa MF-IS2 TaxID=1400762 RepID=A0A9P5XN67_9AGAR|nr:hypothetical protein P691DRAFT_657472 [Macrolepiota fuliginosa MF-IS2]